MPAKLIGKKAFTLIELLVVLAVMGLMMGVVGFSLLGDGGAELGSSQRNFIGILQQARIKAVSSGLTSRIIIHAEDTVDDRFHRYFEVILRDPNATDSWIVENDGVFLEEGVYFVPQNPTASKRPNDWPSDAFCIWSQELGEEFKLEDSFKGVRKEGEGTAFKYLEFDSSGNLICPSSGGSGVQQIPRIVIANGSPNPIDPSVPLQFDSANSMGGILLNRFGGFSFMEKTDFILP